jgi:hypothetical protein
VLRLLWTSDMEYKADEIWTFERSVRALRSEPWPLHGMPTSVEVANPGLSVWPFILLARLTAADDPVRLTRAVQATTVLALAALALLALTAVPQRQREPWFWAVALMAVNPLAVVLQRKLWPTTLLPLCTVVLLAGWLRRRRRWGALLWGLMGGLAGQLNLSGFFFAGGFALWALLFDRHGVRWRWWLVGAVLTVPLLLPWLAYLPSAPRSAPAAALRWGNLFTGQFWLRWITEPFGVSLHYSLEDDFGDFLRGPCLFGVPTWGVGLLHGLMAAIAGVVLLRCGRNLWTERARRRALWIGRGSATAFTQQAALWGFGLLFTVSLLPMNRHYLIVAAPLLFLWAARQALGGDGSDVRTQRSGRVLLLASWLVQFLISAAFLGYVHGRHGPIHGDYGTPYAAQQSVR